MPRPEHRDDFVDQRRSGRDRVVPLWIEHPRLEGNARAAGQRRAVLEIDLTAVERGERGGGEKDEDRKKVASHDLWPVIRQRSAQRLCPRPGSATPSYGRRRRANGPCSERGRIASPLRP